MKSNVKILVLCFAVALISLSCKNETEKTEKETPSTFTLTGDIKNMTSEYLVYYEPDETEADGYRRDTIPVNDGKFTFTDSVETFKIYYIGIPEALRRYKIKSGDKEYDVSVKAQLMRMWFIGYPGAEIDYKGKIVEYMVDAYPTDQRSFK